MADYVHLSDGWYCDCGYMRRSDCDLGNLCRAVRKREERSASAAADRSTHRMLKSMPPRSELNALLEKARNHMMTPEEMFEQRVSFVYGNLAMSNSNITKEMVREAALAELPDKQKLIEGGTMANVKQGLANLRQGLAIKAIADALATLQSQQGKPSADNVETATIIWTALKAAQPFLKDEGDESCS